MSFAFFVGVVSATRAASNLNGVCRLPEEETKMRDGGRKMRDRKRKKGTNVGGGRRKGKEG